MTSTQGVTKRRTRRSNPRRPASVDAPTGPLRPTKKPPPQPSGDCGHGISCWFGLSCVNAHAAADIKFFQRREQLKFELSAMMLHGGGESKARLHAEKTCLQSAPPAEDQHPSSFVDYNIETIIFEDNEIINDHVWWLCSLEQGGCNSEDCSLE